MDSYMASNQKPHLGGRPNTKLGDHGTLNAHNHWYILFYHMWGSAWVEFHWWGIWLRARSHMTSHYTWGSVITTTWFWRCVGTAFGDFLLGSHNFMVMALSSCVKWPLGSINIDLGTYDSFNSMKSGFPIMLVEVKLNDCVNLSMWETHWREYISGNKYEQLLMT